MPATPWIRLQKMFYRARGHVNGMLGGDAFRLDPYHSKFWKKASAGTWEPETFSILEQYLDGNHDYLDIGAWIGPTVLYGACRARHVYCFEPDATAFRYLAWNIDLNGLRNVSAFPVALSQNFGVARMASFGGEAGDSMTSLLNDGQHGTDVLTIGWEDFAQATDLSQVSLVKMDIEGAEFDVLPTLLPWLKTQRPALFLSLHAPYLPEDKRAEQMQDIAQLLGFYDICEDENGAPLAAADFTSDRMTGRFCSVLFRSTAGQV